jgi:RND family efflux transporter MFP subunit
VRGALATCLALATLATPAAGENAVRAECVMMPSMEVRLASAVAGQLAEVPVERGDMVGEGQVIARLESRLHEVELELARLRATSTLELDLAQARLELVGQRAERGERLFAREVVSQENVQELRTEHRLAGLEVDMARREHEAARLQERLAEELLALRAIESPIDGLVVERLLAPGEFVHQEAHVLRLAKLDPLHVEAYLPAAMLPFIDHSARAVVHPQHPVGGTYEARVTVVDHVLDAASGTFGVRLALPNPGNALPAGLRCEVVFTPAGDAATASDSGLDVRVD